MFERFDEAKPDTILALMQSFRADEREDKLDLGVGVYKAADGSTPVMAAVLAAEQQLLDSQTTKSYVSPVGSPAFREAMARQVFGEAMDASRVRAVQAVGGSGALRILGDLIRRARPDARLWLSDPTWPNHVPLLSAAGFELQRFPYYDARASSVDLEAMLGALDTANEGDVVVLHGCCHNPTGADLTHDQWQSVLDLVERRRLFPLIDLAYQGFADGLEQDAWAVRQFAQRLPELAVAASCSKNFGLYRERVGAALLLAADAQQADRALGQLSGTVRSNYSMPPDHGAATTSGILNDDALRAEWQQELEGMRVRMTDLRRRFADGLRKRTNSSRFDYIAAQKGMFSLLPLSADHIETLRADHGIYIVGGGRINVAGLPDDEQRMAALCDAIATVTGATA